MIRRPAEERGGGGAEVAAAVAARPGASDLRSGAARHRDHGSERQAAGHGGAARRAHPHHEGQRGHPEGRHRRQGQSHRRRRRAGEGRRFPSGAKIIDVSGKTIMPGYVDVHAHMWPAFGIHRSQPFEYLVNLAYGVTTTRDPQTSTTDVLSYEDMVETGEFIGPRILSTGPGVFAADADPLARRSARGAQEVLGVLQHRDDQAVHGRRSPHAAVHLDGGARAAPHADARGWPRLQEEPDRSDGRLRRHRAHAADRAALQGRAARCSPTPARRGRRR